MSAAPELRVERFGDARWRVTSPTSSHVVSESPDALELRCDSACKDFAYRARCRHVDAVDHLLDAEREAEPAGRWPEWFERLREYVRQDAIHALQYEKDDPLPRLADDILRALASIEELLRLALSPRRIGRP